MTVSQPRVFLGFPSYQKGNSFESEPPTILCRTWGTWAGTTSATRRSSWNACRRSPLGAPRRFEVGFGGERNKTAQCKHVIRVSTYFGSPQTNHLPAMGEAKRELGHIVAFLIFEATPSFLISLEVFTYQHFLKSPFAWSKARPVCRFQALVC